MTDNEQILHRLEDLHDVLRFCSIETTFTVWERMAINQERGSLLEYLGENPSIRNYKVPDRIEALIKAALRKLKQQQ